MSRWCALVVTVVGIAGCAPTEPAENEVNRVLPRDVNAQVEQLEKQKDMKSKKSVTRYSSYHQ